LKTKDNRQNNHPKQNPRNPRKREKRPTENPPVGSKQQPTQALEKTKTPTQQSPSFLIRVHQRLSAANQTGP
jgi:hypothetical protein